MKNKKLEFWVTNRSNRNVVLSDLNLTINAFCSVNLLDNKHYYYNLEQLKKSATTGSIFKKRDKIIIRKLAPQLDESNKKIKIKEFLNIQDVLPERKKSVLVIKEENYDELNLDDEEFAKENADLVQLDEINLIKHKE